MRWNSLRAVVLGLSVGSMASGADAQTLGPDAELAEPTLSSTAGSQLTPRAARAGDSVVLTFRDRTTPAEETRFVVLEPDGRLRVEVDGRIPFEVNGLACSNASDCLASSVETLDGSVRQWLVRFRTDGTIVGMDLIDESVPFSEFVVDLTATPTGFFYRSGTDTLLPITMVGGIGAPVVIHDATSTVAAGLGCGPADCLAAWFRVPGAGGGLYARRLDHAGAPLGEVLTLSTAGSYVTGRVAHTGTDYAVINESRSNLIGYRVRNDDTFGTVVTLRPGPDFMSVGSPGGGELLLDLSSHEVQVWSGGSTGSLRFGALPSFSDRPVSFACATGGRCVRVTETAERTIAIHDLLMTGSIATERPAVGTGPDLHTGPLAAAGSDRGYVAVFQRSERPYVLVAQPLDSMARPRAGSGTVLSTHDVPLVGVRVVDADTQLGIIHLDEDGGATFRRVTRMGVADGGAISLGTTRRHVALAWNGTHFLTAVVDSRGAVLLQRFDAIGQRVDATPVTLLTGAYDIALTSDGDGFFLLFESDGGVRGLRLTGDLTAVDPAPGFVVRDQPTERIAVDFDGTQYVAMWSEGRTTFQPRVARISTTGEVLDLGGRVLATALGGPYEIALVARPSLSYLAWTNVPMAPATPTPVRYTVLRSMTSDGTLGLSTAAAESLASHNSRQASGLALVGRTYASLLFGQVRTGPGEAAVRMRWRSISDGVAGTTCTVAMDCGTGFCVDGVCCDSACADACSSCATGRCELAAAGSECRAAMSACDSAEVCDGVSMTCPSAEDVCPDAGVDLDGGFAESNDAGAGLTVDAGAPPAPVGSCACSSGARREGASWLAAPVGLLLLFGMRGRSRRAAKERPQSRSPLSVR